MMVSKNLVSSKYKDENGTLSLDKVLNAPRRGHCANPGCSLTSQDQKLKLRRCQGCWQVDYCSRDCQKSDWKRHKQNECVVRKKSTKEEAETENDKDKKHGRKKTKDDNENLAAKESTECWQSLAWNAKQAMKKHDYMEAIGYLHQSLEKERSVASPLMSMLSICYLESGDARRALEWSYKACQADYGNPMTLVTKAKCHLALNDIEAGFLSIYSSYNSHQLRLQTNRGDHAIERDDVLPLYQKLTQRLMNHIVTTSQPSLTQADFPLEGYPIASVPCSIRFGPGGQGCLILQDLVGSGFHSCQPKNGTAVFPPLQNHTAVTDGSRLILFGGFNGGEAVNTVRLFELDPSDSNLYSLKTQPCSGDIPPTQGHAACILGRQMFVYGGAITDNDMSHVDMYILDLEEWKWTKLPTLSGTPNAGDRPETEVCFGTLVPLDESSILLVGGRRLRMDTEASSEGVNHYGFASFDGTDFASQNMHVFSIKTGKWKQLTCTGSVPKGWGLQAHNIGKGEVLLFGGQQEDTRIDNTLYLLTTDDDGGAEWSRIEESLAGIPPSQSMFRATAWNASAQRLFLFGGRFLHFRISDSVFKAKDNEDDIKKCQVLHDTELYSFDLSSKQWTRLRVPEGGVNMRNTFKHLFQAGH
jgi:hypothetical protein